MSGGDAGAGAGVRGALPVVASVLFFGCLVAALALGAGVLVQHADPTVPEPPWALLPQTVAAAGAAAAAALLGVFCARRQRREFVFHVILWTLLAVATLALSEWTAGFFVPPWPARGLHGVSPAEPGAWATRAGTRPGAVGVNSWGQRDRERSRHPPAGRRRIVFIGDSFLEESSAMPLPLAVEEKLGPGAFDVVNLGVSGTDPDEYYWRLQEIALPLRPAHVVVVIYAGNDFISRPSLPSRGGIAAPYPKRSVLSLLGLEGLNHLATNGDRPVIRIWRGAGDLHAQEKQLHERIRRANDAELPHLLAGFAPPPLQGALSAHLAGRDLRAFYAGLRAPDAGLYRSYYLVAALQSSDPLFEGPPPVDAQAAGYVLSLLERMAATCRARGIAFSVALAPEASQVDPRFQRFWGSMSRLTEQKAFTRELSERLAVAARARKIAVVDLSAALQGLEGAYYNLDGHWSGIGVEAAAAQLARHLAGAGAGQ